jgi:DNA-binding CsgD family transcriptional regulator
MTETIGYDQLDQWWDAESTGSPGTDLESVYAYALRTGGAIAGDPVLAAELDLPPAAIDMAIDELRRLQLLREEVGSRPLRWRPVNPEVAAALLISPIDEEVHRRRAAICRIRESLNTFRPHYEESMNAGSTAPGIEVLHDRDELAGHLYVASTRCRRELVCFRPNGWLVPEHHATRPSWLNGPALRARGVRVRLLLQHAVRADIRARAHLCELVADGAEIRTTGQLPKQLMIFDREVAFLVHDDPPTGRSGVMIRHAGTVPLLLDLVEWIWDTAQAYSAKELGYHDVAENLHRTIVELLAEGFTDEATARRLGVSVRTCRRHIAAVLRNLDSVSRFQAGVQAAATGLVEIERSVRSADRHLRIAG